MTSATMSEFGTGNLLKISFKLVSTDDKLTSLIGFKTPNSTPSNENNVMSGSFHLDRALKVKIGIECQIFVIVIFLNCGRVLQFAEIRYNGALTQKRSFLVISATFRSAFHVG